MHEGVFGIACEHVATMSLDSSGKSVSVELTQTPATAWTEVTYAWLSPSAEVLRIGTSNQPIGRRLSAYAKDINKRLREGRGRTPSAEVESWLLRLQEFGRLDAFAHLPSAVETVAGPIRPYLDIERTLIAKYKPILNTSHR